MKINKGYIVAGLIIAFTLFFEIAAHADVLDQETKLTFSEPVQIPGQTLAAGTYLFQLVNADIGQDTVQIFNADRTVLYATLQTISADRAEATDQTVITLAEGSGEPGAIVKWFYPGNVIGHEFLYPKEKEKVLAQEKVQVVTVNQSIREKSDKSEVGD